MTVRSLFSVILKIIGIFLLKEIVNAIPQLISSLVYFTQEGGIEEGAWTFLFSAFVLIFYTFIVFKLLFKTNYFIDKLKLDKGFSQEEFSFNISPASVLTIALIVTGAIILINEIPNLCRQLFLFFQERKLSHGMTKPDPSFSIVALVKIILALLIMGERKRIVEFIEARKTKPTQD